MGWHKRGWHKILKKNGGWHKKGGIKKKTNAAAAAKGDLYYVK